MSDPVATSDYAHHSSVCAYTQGYEQGCVAAIIAWVKRLCCCHDSLSYVEISVRIRYSPREEVFAVVPPIARHLLSRASQWARQQDPYSTFK